MLCKEDYTYLAEKGIEKERVEELIQTIQAGQKFLKLEKPTTIGDGILKHEPAEVQKYIDLYDASYQELDCMKFVPASGAATRMFHRMIFLRDQYKGKIEEFIEVSAQRGFYSVKNSFDNLQKFAFYPELFRRFFRRGTNLERLVRKNDYKKVASMLLGKKGLNYAQLPKAMILFHKYPGHARTAFEEHLQEAAMYCQDKNGKAHLHFTIDPRFQKQFEKREKLAYKNFLKEAGAKMHIEYSQQYPTTDSITLDENGEILRDKEGMPVLRPGGHGALLNNLNTLDADMIFVKNIDNVAPDNTKHETVKYKKLLGGIMIELREQVFEYLRILDKHPDDARLGEIEIFVKEKFGLTEIPTESASKKRCLKKFLNRPIRICGMVENTGEPGGGPFWVKDKKGRNSLQIVEKAQINFSNKAQAAIVDDATHFNPVDMVCCVRDYKGKSFDLKKFRNDKAGFVVKKNHQGSSVFSYELPGLWNGAMAEWITLFVEVPLISFNPVKEVNDLLRMEHQTAK